jgi:hypothetical protein
VQEQCDEVDIDVVGNGVINCLRTSRFVWQILTRQDYQMEVNERVILLHALPVSWVVALQRCSRFNFREFDDHVNAVIWQLFFSTRLRNLRFAYVTYVA